MFVKYIYAYNYTYMFIYGIHNIFTIAKYKSEKSNSKKFIAKTVLK